MRIERARAVSRRAVAWDPGRGVLTVGERSVMLTCTEGDNECILRTYLHLVAEQREVALDRSVVLRRDDVVALAELLDLDDVRLERQLASILRLSDPDARELRRELLRHRVTVAAVSVGLAAALPLGVAASAETPEAAPIPAHRVEEAPALVVFLPTTTSITVAPEATTTTAAVPPAAPPTEAPDDASVEDGTEIGYSVTYERDPNFVPPEGVEIGDALVIERDVPPAG